MADDQTTNTSSSQQDSPTSNSETSTAQTHGIDLRKKSSNTPESIQQIQPRSKPDFKLPPGVGSATLHDRLRSFLPQMEESNKKLNAEGARNIEDVDEDDEHIVMELGLGVLEHKSSSDDDSSSGSESDASAPKKDALDTLLGRSSPITKPDIQEIG